MRNPKLEEVFVTNSTNPVAAGHRHYIRGLDDSDCTQVMMLPLYDMCEFSRNTNACHNAERYISYANHVFCNMISTNDDFAIVFATLGLFTILYVGILTVLSLTSFAPNILSIANYFQLSEHTSGIILVCLFSNLRTVVKTLLYKRGLALSDFTSFDSVAYINHSQGSVMFFRSLLSGIILIHTPISFYPAFFLRDEFFYFLALSTVLPMFIQQKVTAMNGYFTIAVYLTYIVLVVAHERLIKQKLKKLKLQITKLKFRRTIYKLMKKNDSSLNKDAILDISKELARHQGTLDTIKPIDYPQIKSTVFPFRGGRNDYIIHQFLISVDPRKFPERVNTRRWERIVLTIGFPINIFFSLFIPVVNLRLPLHGWSKLLNVITIFLCPTIFLIQYQTEIHLIVYIFICALGLLIFLITRTDTPPKYHIVFAFVGLYISIELVSIVTRELVAIWTLMGFITGMTKELIQNIFSALAGGISDAIVCGVFIGMGHARMAYVSLLAYPIFRFCFKMGYTVVLYAKEEPNEELEFRSGAVGATGLIFIVIEFFATINVTSLLNYHLRRSVGFFLIIVYMIFLMYITLDELEIIHAFGSDHTPGDPLKTGSAWA